MFPAGTVVTLFTSIRFRMIFQGGEQTDIRRFDFVLVEKFIKQWELQLNNVFCGALFTTRYAQTAWGHREAQSLYGPQRLSPLCPMTASKFWGDTESPWRGRSWTQHTSYSRTQGLFTQYALLSLPNNTSHFLLFLSSSSICRKITLSCSSFSKMLGSVTLGFCECM